jgi:acyl-coenzyme A thioesterase PaaI-like protein
VNDLRSEANNCFVCSPTNPIGLHLEYRIENDICLSEFTPGANHCGYDNVTHGGIIFSVLDDVMANWVFLKGIKAFTAKCELRYKGELPIGTRVRLEGECIKQRGRLTVMKGTMTREDNNKVVAECEASFMQAVET